MFTRRIPLAALPMLLFACAEPNMNSTPASTDQAATQLSSGINVMIQAAQGEFVACELGVEGERRGILLANRPSAGEWEHFTMFTRGDGKVVFQASNGKYVCADDDRAGQLVANRDQAGEWEAFTLVPKDNGKVALQTHNGNFVAADYGLGEGLKGSLIGDRKEAHEWELFAIIPDTLKLP